MSNYPDGSNTDSAPWNEPEQLDISSEELEALEISQEEAELERQLDALDSEY